MNHQHPARKPKPPRSAAQRPVLTWTGPPASKADARQGSITLLAQAICEHVCGEKLH